MAKYKKCPRCELNWILKKQDLCDVCKAELNYDGSQNYEEEEEIEEFLDDIEELCPVCKSNYIHGKETMCESCRRSKYRGLDDIEKSEEEWDDNEKDETCDIEDEDEEKLISLNAMQEEESEEMRALEGRCKELKLLLFSFSTAAAVGVCTGLRPFLVFEGELSGAGKTVSRFTSTLRRATTFTDNESTSKMNGDDTAKSKKAFLKFVWIERPFRSTDRPNRFRSDD